MKKIFVTITVLSLLLSAFLSYAADTKEEYIAPSDPTNSIVGNWARVYPVNMRNGNTFQQMEIFTFDKHNTYAAFYYAEETRRPFKKYYGHYEHDLPLLILYGHDKGGVAPHNKVWKDCTVLGETMTCLGYHDEHIPFRRWYSRPDELYDDCCMMGWAGTLSP